VALVTGAARGLGLSIAARLAHDGARVVVNDIDAAAARSAARSLTDQGFDVVAIPADVSDPEAVASMFGEVERQAGRLDWLVNNAAVYVRQYTPFWEASAAEWDRVIGATLTSVFLCGKFAAPIMVRQNYGRIVNIASQSALSYVPWQGPHYHAAKAGVVHLTRVMGVQLGPHGVTVNAVSPTAVATPESAERLARDGAAPDIIQHIPVGRFARPEEVSASVAFLLSDEAGFINGETLVVNGGVMGFGLGPTRS
jgi:3-oxoacyl-[acyl-carrier protein] reductase